MFLETRKAGDAFEQKILWHMADPQRNKQTGHRKTKKWSRDETRVPGTHIWKKCSKTLLFSLKHVNNEMSQVVSASLFDSVVHLTFILPL